MKVLIFGGTGFLGSETNRLLKTYKHETYTASVKNSKSDFTIDISKLESFNSLPLNYFDIVINCASILPGGNFLDIKNLNKTYEINILGTQNICNWINTQVTIKKIINCSTLVINKKPWKINIEETTESFNYGKHVVYSSSKLFQELLFKTFCEKNKIALAQIRYSAIYGKSMKKIGVIWNLINQFKENNNIKLYNSKKISFDFINVKDAASIIKTVIDKDFNGILNAASGMEISIFELATIIKNKIKSKAIIEESETEPFQEDRSSISLKKLSEIINVKSFIPLENGIDQLIS